MVVLLLEQIHGGGFRPTARPPPAPSLPPCGLAAASDAFEERGNAILHNISPPKAKCLAICIVCWSRFLREAKMHLPPAVGLKPNGGNPRGSGPIAILGPEHARGWIDHPQRKIRLHIPDPTHRADSPTPTAVPAAPPASPAL
jgi:hypothetical protein